MFSKIAIAIVVAALLLVTSVATGQARGRMRVTAVIPPQICLYPGACSALPGGIATRVTIDHEEIRYLGSRPNVTEKDGLLQVVF